MNNDRIAQSAIKRRKGDVMNSTPESLGPDKEPVRGASLVPLAGTLPFHLVERSVPLAGTLDSDSVASSRSTGWNGRTLY